MQNIKKISIKNHNNNGYLDQNSMDKILRELHLLYSGKSDLIRPVFDKRYNNKSTNTTHDNNNMDYISSKNNDTTLPSYASNISAPNSINNSTNPLYNQVESICNRVYNKKKLELINNNSKNSIINKNSSNIFPDRENIIHNYNPKYIKSLQNSVLFDKRPYLGLLGTETSSNKSNINYCDKKKILPSLSRISIISNKRRKKNEENQRLNENLNSNADTNEKQVEVRSKSLDENKFLENKSSFNINCVGVNLNSNNQQYYLLFKKDKKKVGLPPIQNKWKQVSIALPSNKENNFEDMVENFKRMKEKNKKRFLI